MSCLLEKVIGEVKEVSGVNICGSDIEEFINISGHTLESIYEMITEGNLVVKIDGETMYNWLNDSMNAMRDALDEIINMDVDGLIKDLHAYKGRTLVDYLLDRDGRVFRMQNFTAFVYE